jgi:hypothetical protein
MREAAFHPLFIERWRIIGKRKLSKGKDYRDASSAALRRAFWLVISI